MDFEVMLSGGSGHFHIHGRGNVEIPPNKLIFDPSVLHYLMSHELKYNNNYQVYIPNSLYKLISLSKDSDEYKAFLSKLLFYFSYSPYRHRNRRNSEMSQCNWERFYDNIEKISFTKISDEDVEDKQEYHAILSMFRNRQFYISMSPKLNLLGDVIATIIGFSKKTGVPILCKTRNFANLLREKIVSIELPKRFDDVVIKKQEITGQLFRFHGGRATKFFIGVVLSVGGSIYPAIGVLGIVFVFMDP